MSVHFAIPATSFVLRAIIQARLKASYGIFPPPLVSIEPPPRPPAPTPGNGVAEPAGLILYMHHAGANAAWRNMYDPHIDGMGKRFAKAPLVLDLHYPNFLNSREKASKINMGLSKVFTTKLGLGGERTSART